MNGFTSQHASTPAPNLVPLWARATDSVRDLAYFLNCLAGGRRGAHGPSKSITDPGSKWLALLLLGNLAETVHSLNAALLPAHAGAGAGAAEVRSTIQPARNRDIARIVRHAVALRDVVLAGLEQPGTRRGARGRAQGLEVLSSQLLGWLAATFDSLTLLVEGQGVRAAERVQPKQPRLRAPSTTAAAVRRSQRAGRVTASGPTGAERLELLRLLRRGRRSVALLLEDTRAHGGAEGR